MPHIQIAIEVGALHPMLANHTCRALRRLCVPSYRECFVLGSSCAIGAVVVSNESQGVGCPYMLDPRHPPDSVFIVAEQDFRFYPEDCLRDWISIVADKTKPALDENLQEIPGAYAAPSPSPGDAAPPQSPSPAQGPAEEEEDTRSKKRKFMEWNAAEHSHERFAVASPEIRELAQCCNVAERIGHGSLIWFGWCPGGRQRSVPSHGSHLIAVTRHGARHLLAAMENGELKMGHWDIVLRDWLVQQNYQHPRKMGACFVWPSTGGFQTHASGCDPKIGDRVGDWNQSYLQPGVAPRPGKDHERDRWLAYWPEDGKGGAQWLHKMEFDIPYNIWKTENPPTTWYSDDYDWQTLLWNRYWVDRSGNWIGPEWAAENKGKGRDKGSWWTPSAAANKWAELLADPDGYAWNAQTKSYEPITRCAEQLVVDGNHFDWNGRHSQRIWSVRNKAIALYKKRSFQNDPADNVAA